MAGSAARMFIDLAIASSTSGGCASMRVSRSVKAAPLCLSPRSGKAKMHEDLAPKLGQMRIAAMTGIRSSIHDLGFDARGALAQHDNSAGEEHGLFHIMGDQKRGEARLLPE
jgi:hypothetical protein